MASYIQIDPISQETNSEVEHTSYRWNKADDSLEETKVIIKKRTWKCIVPLWIHPLVMGLSIPFACIVTYILLLDAEEDLPSPPSWGTGFPYISDAGIYPPGSCWFTLLFTFVAFFSFSTSIVRYKQLKVGCRDRRCISVLNIIAMLTGCAAALGILMVGAFQYTNARVLHLFGAGTAFISGTLFCVLQTVLSFAVPNLPGNTKTCRVIRVFMNLINVTDLICLSVFLLQFHNKNTEDKRQSAAIAEWILAICIGLYPLTFVHEMRHFVLDQKLKYVTELESNVTCCFVCPKH